MMIGEFEFGGIFLEGGIGEPHSSHLFLPEATYMIFVLFLIIVAILIMNLLVGKL